MNKRASQRPIRLRRIACLATAAALLGMAGSASAVQYQWRDERGRMVYSDQPPPASVAPARIIKAPAPAPVATNATAPAAADGGNALRAAAPAAAPAVAKDPAATTIADQELAFRKRMAERAEAEKKAAEAAEREMKLARACADAKGDIRSLESGQRISRINESGEREFLSEAERQQRLQDARRSISERC